MIKHVILWKFREGTRPEMEAFLEKLQALSGQIPQIRSLEGGVSVNPENNYDAVLISTFDTLEDMKRYQEDPRHKAVSALCKAIRTDRGAVDFVVREP